MIRFRVNVYTWDLKCHTHSNHFFPDIFNPCGYLPKNTVIFSVRWVIYLKNTFFITFMSFIRDIYVFYTRHLCRFYDINFILMWYYVVYVRHLCRFYHIYVVLIAFMSFIWYLCHIYTSSVAVTGSMRCFGNWICWLRYAKKSW